MFESGWKLRGDVGYRVANRLSADGSGRQELASSARRYIELLPSYETDSAILLNGELVDVTQCLDRVA